VLFVSRAGLSLAIALAAVLVLSGAWFGSGPKPVPTPKTGAVPWPAPSDPIALTEQAGLVPETYEHLIHHVHSHLDIFVNGRSVVIPAGIGINIHDPAVHQYPAPDGTPSYGGIDPPCAKPCISPLHTHADLGLLHTESISAQPNTLGEFFTEWNVRLDQRCVGGYCKPDPISIYVNGKLYRGDPRAIQLTNYTEIAIVVGPPPKQIPTSFPTNVPI
jgi:hypothetical protein